MLNVLHLIYNWGKGGFESYVQSLTEKLHKRKCNIFVGYSERLPMPALVEKLGLKTFHIAMASPYDFNAARKLARLCSEYSIDAVHTHFIRERYIAVLSKLFGNKARLIYTSHVVVEKSWLLKLSNRFLNRFEDRVIAVCYAGRDQMLLEGLDKRKIAVIQNGVDIGYWSRESCSTIRSELGIDEGSFVIATTGRFQEEKGHAFLIEAIKHLKRLLESKRSQNKFVFLLVGDGELLEECKSLAQDLGVSEDIIFTGFRTDIRNILHGSDIYVSPSRSEALSMSIIEALACGLPVVATDVGGTSEVINEENRCGLLVEYGDAAGFARAILKFMEDADFYREYSKNAFNTAKNKFNLDKTALETYNLYRGG